MQQLILVDTTSSWYYSRNIEGDIRDNVPPSPNIGGGGHVPPVPYGRRPWYWSASFWLQPCLCTRTPRTRAHLPIAPHT